MIIKILSSAKTFEGIDYSERKNELGKSQLLKVENFGALGHGGEELSKVDYINYMKFICDSRSEEKYDYEYERCGVCNIFMANEPLIGRRYVKITKSKTKIDWAEYLNEIAGLYEDAEKITLVMDNLNTHKPGALYDTYKPEKAKQLWDRFEFVYTPKHGSWLNMADIELNVLIGQCLNRRIDTIEMVTNEAKAWGKARNHKKAKINWQFTTDDARIKLNRLYPTFDD